MPLPGPAAWGAACGAARRLARRARALPPPAQAEAFRRLLERHFAAWPLGTGLMTGYYEPELPGAEAPTPAFRTPLHGLPALDPPFPDRAAIEAGALDGRAPVLAWADPVEAFFLQIQGSGRVLLPGGRVLRLGYAGKNGHPYRPIGRSLVERGALPREAVSMQSIRAWLAAAPAEAAAALLRENPSYVFFRPVEGLAPEQGPIGTLGVPLTPGRSIAVDAGQVPLGAPVFVAVRDPVGGGPMRRLMLAQDTGGAIRGRARADFFWGWGAGAAERAGRMREEARLTLLLPR